MEPTTRKRRGLRILGASAVVLVLVAAGVLPGLASVSAQGPAPGAPDWVQRLVDLGRAVHMAVDRLLVRLNPAEVARAAAEAGEEAFGQEPSAVDPEPASPPTLDKEDLAGSDEWVYGSYTGILTPPGCDLVPGLSEPERSEAFEIWMDASKYVGDDPDKYHSMTSLVEGVWQQLKGDLWAGE
ncbi:MAG TPA: hypothetical protein PLJ35_07325 [Anaerolineae bacterium]|nr:hypothetical protein [Anaerolineae bacterium]HOQ98617.1 hypothetical protein [Anaerolineae bacterium]HPL27156.1 hypothetical protein [Anaerolineae bacterium]